VTVRAIAGLALLNGLYLVAGAGLLWAVRGWRTWLELARLAGLAYLTGVATVAALWVLILVAGGSLSIWLLLGAPVGIATVGLLVGRRLGRRAPAFGNLEATVSASVAAAGIALTGVFFEALFRATRLSGLFSWDAWSIWVSKAKAIYFYGGFDEQFFTSLPNAPYPPLVPTLDAAAFHAMGGPDVVTLHLQFWFLALGFVWALAGLLSERVPAWILWPSLLMLLVAPRFGPRFAVPEADFLVGFCFVVAAILVYLWVEDGERWRLLMAAVLLCGLVLTKREGILLAVVLGASALLVSATSWRKVWPPLAAVGALVVLVGVPWRIWYVLHGVAGEAPATGLIPAGSEGRLWPSFRLALEVLFAGGYWSVVVPVALGALLMAALARRFVPVVFFGSLLVFVTLGGGWITWATWAPITAEPSVNPIVRYMGSGVLLAAAATPLLLAGAWRGADRLEKERA